MLEVDSSLKTKRLMLSHGRSVVLYLVVPATSIYRVLVELVAAP